VPGLRTAAALLPLPGLLAGGYLDLLLAASRRGSPPLPVAGPRRAFAVLIPAHDEAEGLPATLRSLAALRYPADRFEVVVIADNCRDATAAVARAQGATVLERDDPAHPGKGPALAWGIARLGPHDAVVVVDADCTVSPGLLDAFDRVLAAGADAAQASYRTGNPDASGPAALRHAAFLLFNHVRPLGRERLHLSAGLYGTGMCFTRELLERVPWSAFLFAEDREYHLQLVEAGARVRFVADEQVVSPMPTSDAGARSQQARWDSGRLALARRHTPRLLARALRRRDPVALDAALEPLVPPQALLAAMNGAACALALAARAPAGRRLAALACGTQAAFVLGGLRSVGAPPEAWRALALAPRFVAARVLRLARMGAGDGPARWERTEREPAEARA
jgi:1,2-diacylglycerol 3-beta-glucosyltransferase